jgi:hypothetical protein
MKKIKDITYFNNESFKAFQDDRKELYAITNEISFWKIDTELHWELFIKESSTFNLLTFLSFDLN